MCHVGDVASWFGLGASSAYPDEEVYFGGLALRGNYVQRLAIVTNFKELGGANKWGRGRC